MGRAVAQGELGFSGGQGTRQGGQGGVRVVEVDQDHTVGVFRLRAPGQTPYGGGAGRGAGVVRARGDRPVGDEDQPGAGRPLLGEPGTQQAA